MELFGVALTALFSAAALFVITKWMGHKQVAQLDFFDYICGITIGSIAAELATELEAPLKPLVAMAVYGAVSIALSLLTHKLPRTRKYVNGTPTILFNDGTLYRENLKKAKLDLSEFLLLCREQGYFDLCDIQCAVFEANGKLSILPTGTGRPATPSDLGLVAPRTEIGVELILDGRVMGENLGRLGLDAAWLSHELQARGFRDARAILLAVYRPREERLFLYPKK